MKKKQVHFQMILDQTKTTFDVPGFFEENVLSFLDPEGNQNRIIFKKDMVEYKKTGEKTMHYTFQENQRTEGIYKVDSFAFHFQIDTTYMDTREEKLNINFTLRQDDEILGHHALTIFYKDDEEE
jgi:uncharacterized beta-barrel protein YwiB (DUF1934 family)